MNVKGVGSASNQFWGSYSKRADEAGGGDGAHCTIYIKYI
jgi:hypothetical protein